MAGTTSAVKIIFEGVDNLSDVAKKIGGEFSESSGLGKSLKNVALLAGGAVVAGFAAAGAALGKFAADGVGNAIQLEQQIANIGAVMGASGDDIKNLNDLILDLGVDPGLKVSTFEAADAIEMLARNGLSMTDIMDGAAKSTVILANATGGDFGLAADIATDTMALFNIEAKDMETAVNGITSVVTNSKFSIDDYRLALAQGGGVAASVGVEFEDFNSTIAAISPLFASGSDAGTSLKTLLLRLAPSTDKAKEAMSDLGLMTFDTTNAFNFLSEQGYTPLSKSIDDINGQFADMQSELGLTDDEINQMKGSLITSQNAFFDSEGNMKSMAEISQLLADATAGLSEEQKNNAFNTIFGTDAMRAAFGIADSGKVIYTDVAKAAEELGISQDVLNKYIDGGITQFEALQAKMSQTDAADAVAMRMNTLSGQMEILQGTVEAFGIKVGQAFLPALKAMVSNIQSFVDDHGDQLVAMFETIVNWLSSAIPAAIQTTSNLWSQVLVPAIQAVSDYINSNLIPIFNSIVVVFGKVSDYVNSTLIPTFNTVLSSFQSIASNGQSQWATIQAIILTAWELIQAAVTSAIAVIQPAIEQFVTTFQSRFSEFDDLIPQFQALWEVMQPAVTAVLTLLGGAILGLVGIAVSMVTGVAEAINPLITTFELVVAGVTKTLTGLFDFINNFVGLVVALFQGNSEQVQASWDGMGKALITIVTGLSETIVGAIMGMVATILSFISGFVEGIIAYFTTLYDTLVGGSIIPEMVAMIIAVLQNMVAVILPMIQAMVEQFIEKIKTMVDTTVAKMREAAANFTTATVTIMTNILTTVTSKAADVVRAIERMISDAIDRFHDKVDDFRKAGKDVIEGFIQGMKENAGKVLEKIEEIIGGAFDELKRRLGIGSPSRLLMEYGEMTGLGFAIGVEKTKRAIQDAMSGTFGGLYTTGLNNGMGGASQTTNNNYYTMNINSNSPREPITQDFQILKSRTAVV